MLFKNSQIPDVYPNNYYTDVDLFIWIAVILLGIIGVFFFLKWANNSELKIQKSIYNGIGILLLFLSFMRFFYLFAVLFEVDYDFFVTLGYISQMSAFTGFLYKAEDKVFPKTKHLFTIISFIGILSGISTEIGILDRNLTRYISTGISILITLVMIVFFLRIIFQTSGAVRNKMTSSSIGVTLMFVGNVLDSEIFYGFWNSMPVIMPPILAFIGLLIFIYYQTPVTVSVTSE